MTKYPIECLWIRYRLKDPMGRLYMNIYYVELC